jgi:hypothetical protein
MISSRRIRRAKAAALAEKEKNTGLMLGSDKKNLIVITEYY